MSTPYIGFGNDTLAQHPRATKGQMIRCHCGQEHPLEYGTVEEKESDLLGFITCGPNQYLAAVSGKLVFKCKPDVSGAI